MSRSLKVLVAVLVAVTAVSVAAMVFMAAHRQGSDEGDEDEEQAVKTTSRVSVRDGRTVITLDRQTQAKEGIGVKPVAEATVPLEARGTAVLLPVVDLATVRNGYVAARSRLERDEVAVRLSRSQYERVKTLYEEDQNMSLAATQAAEAAYRTNQAQARADRQQADLQVETARQRWGPVVASWVTTNDARLQAVVEQRSFLAQVMLPPGEVANAPPAVSLALPGGQAVQGSLLSSLPQVNAQIQGISFAYLVPARAGLAVGMNLPVLVPVGPPVRGSVVPQAAVVWWQGRAWVYQALSTTTFTRRELPASNPVEQGYFVPGDHLPAGTELVTAGAQILLSEEFRSRIQQQE